MVEGRNFEMVWGLVSRAWDLGYRALRPCLLDLRVVEPVFVCEGTALDPPHLVSGIEVGREEVGKREGRRERREDGGGGTRETDGGRGE